MFILKRSAVKKHDFFNENLFKQVSKILPNFSRVQENLIAKRGHEASTNTPPKLQQCVLEI